MGVVGGGGCVCVLCVWWCVVCCAVGSVVCGEVVNVCVCVAVCGLEGTRHVA